jgi:hypothetical protein
MVGKSLNWSGVKLNGQVSLSDMTAWHDQNNCREEESEQTFARINGRRGMIF